MGNNASELNRFCSWEREKKNGAGKKGLRKKKESHVVAKERSERGTMLVKATAWIGTINCMGGIWGKSGTETNGIVQLRGLTKKTTTVKQQSAMSKEEQIGEGGVGWGGGGWGRGWWGGGGAGGGQGCNVNSVQTDHCLVYSGNKHGVSTHRQWDLKKKIV